MKVLVDTHALLWFGLSDSRLSVVARSVIENAANEVLLSPASYWEIAIKIRAGKYAIGQDYRSFMEQQILQLNLTILPIELEHTSIVTTLDLHHRDPFDRLLVAQALVEGVPIVSADAIFARYGVPLIW